MRGAVGLCLGGDGFWTRVGVGVGTLMRGTGVGALIGTRVGALAGGDGGGGEGANGVTGGGDGCVAGYVGGRQRCSCVCFVARAGKGTVEWRHKEERCCILQHAHCAML